MRKILFYTAIAGVLGTTLGGLISIVFKGKKIFNTQVVLGIAAGFMLGITVFDLLPEALEQTQWYVVILGTVAGLVIVGAIEYILTHRKKKGEQLYSSGGHYAHMGTVLLIAISLHNFPEGMAIGGTAMHGSALAMTILIMLHNIPEGMAIATPMLESGSGRWKIITMLIASGIPTIFGGLIGGLLGGIGAVVSGLTLSLAAGAMLFVVIFELNTEVYTSKAGVIKGAVGNIFGLLTALVLIVLI